MKDIPKKKKFSTGRITYKKNITDKNMKNLRKIKHVAACKKDGYFFFSDPSPSYFL